MERTPREHASVMTEKKSFWLTKDAEIAIYGEALPRNYHGESRPPHYIYFKQMIDGELIKFSTGKTALVDALKVAPKMLKDRLKEDPTENIRHLYGDHWPSFIAQKDKELRQGDLKEQTHSLIKRTAEKILPFWKRKFLHKLDAKPDLKNPDSQTNTCWEAEFDAFMKWSDETLPGESRFNTVKYLNAYNNWMHKNGLIKRRVRFKDPNAKADRKRLKRDMGRILTEQELITLLGLANPKQQLAILFGYFMAFRISDATSLEWDRVNMDPSDPYVQFFGDDKEETYAKSPIPEMLFNVLVDLKAKADTPWVMPKMDKLGPIKPQTLDFNILFAAAGLPDFTFHTFRHTRLTLDFGNPNIPDSEVMIMRRVSLPVAIEHYIHPNQDSRRRLATNDSLTLSKEVSEKVTGLKLYLSLELQNAPYEE